ncbi:MAG TPA: 5-(carboxyamino)imidazole ribonucleotide synthase [Gammaproteobacteria bacterium]|nr:5-(carboxyamino)imidazole ribonucleotide synthase [Gammaproteobacteria bacterium]|tara:strand:+ start:795 stop:1937 length:1143 start_codon:yes stop_codon:yes gene_type:complete
MTQFRVGIVGGGQLAGMLTEACREANFSCWVLDPDGHCPAVLAGASHVPGDSWDLNALRSLSAAVDVVTIEIENVDVDNLAVLEAEGIDVVPSSHTLARVVDKLIQKETLQAASLPTPAFKAQVAGEVIEKPPFGLPLVWKASRGGYDGRGVIVIDDSVNLPWCPEVDGYIESFVDAQMEIAVMVAVSHKQESVTWTAVEMAFSRDTNMLQHLIAPARISPSIDIKARDLAVASVHAINGTGLFGVEMFLTKENELLINEIAPRAHNSGHFSMDAAKTSQFEQQARILSGRPLSSTEQTSPAVMVNILGMKGYRGETVVENLEKVQRILGTHVHLYGKRECFHSRKMGHATVTAATIDEAIERSEELQSLLVVRGAEESG